MDKKTAHNLIEDTFNDSFSEERFTIFAKNLLNDLEPKSNFYTGNLVWDDYKEHINTYKRIGKYIDPEGEALDVLIVEVKSVTKLERARTVLRNFVIKHLSKFEKDYALVAFYSKEDEGNDWRFSFIKLEYKSELDEVKGKVKTKKEFTPAKRYSFLVGKYEKAHTAKNQLLPLLQNIANNPTIEELEAAFSIEKVTDEFFNQYKDLYIKLYEHFENDSHVKAAIDKAEIDNTRFTKKLLGQIVFLYFLQKKGWLGVAKNERWGTGKKRFVQELNEQAQSEGVNFFKDKLQYLFYEALAKERDNVNSYYERFNCRIPFLNGGLFEADYDWRNANITIPETLFRNKEKNKSGDEGTGVLDVFDRYNFTIKEDEPLDKEVAVDPEMLGKVFENMLDITERKSKGAFYTPREIVHYMCQESLIHYLDNALNSGTSSYQELGSDQTKLFGGSTDKKGNLKIELEHTDNIRVPKKDIETFIREGHFALENDERVAAKGETKTYKYQLPESIRQNADLIDQKLSDIRICDPAIGSGAFPVGLLHELVNAMLVLKPHFSDDYLTKKLKDFGIEHRESVSESRYIYRLKRHIIQESIYGVDIDASAIDIARLRLWLSLVVDEDDLDPIETLPNLDYKIVCGNSLIGLPDGAMRNLKVEAELETLKEQFYDITDETKKKALRQEINTKIRELLDSAEQFAGYKIDFDFKLFFSEVWREKGGFDVVIGNPPYVNIYSIPDNDKTVYNKVYCTAYKKYDLYVLFFEKGLELLKQSGGINLITSNKYFSQPYGLKLRELFLKYRILELVNFRFNVFSATVDTAITHIQKKSTLSWIEILDINDKKSFEKFINNVRVKLDLDFIRKLPDNLFRIEVSEKDITLLKTLDEKSINFSTVCYVNYGCRLVSKKGHKKKKDYIFLENDNGKYKPFVEGSDIRKYKIISNRFVDYRPDEHYLSLFPELFDNKKLTSKDVVGKDGISVAFDQFGYYNDHTTINAVRWCDLKEVNYSGINREITSEKIKLSEKYSYYELLGYINSEISNYYFNKLYNIDLHFYPGTFQKMIIPKTSSKELKIILSYITFSNTRITHDLLTTYFTALSNALIYELYFPEEIKSAGKEILKHLGDLKPITDDMSEEKKLAIIQSEFERLYDPNHPVRFAIETLDSVEEVRIIKEALK
jgi:hypothetical protein